MTSGVPIQGKRESGGHLDIVLVCARAGEIEAPLKQPSVEEMGRRLAEVVRLAAADHRRPLERFDRRRGHRLNRLAGGRDA
jgi:hypothetical protein